MRLPDLSFVNEFAGNEWFTRSYWPENRDRAIAMLTDIQKRLPPGSRVFDVGCGNGYISMLLADNGYRVTATDAWLIPERGRMFTSRNIEFFESNLNIIRPFANVPNGTFDAVVLGEVIEHILNHPLGLLQELKRVLRPHGILILTTPNPSTVANAFRVLLDRHSLWGTEAFASQPKFDQKIIDAGDIHYREYRTIELKGLLTAAGFDVEVVRFMAMGASDVQPFVKRLVKKILGRTLTSRAFGSGQYVMAHSRAGAGNSDA